MASLLLNGKRSRTDPRRCHVVVVRWIRLPKRLERGVSTSRTLFRFDSDPCCRDSTLPIPFMTIASSLVKTVGDH